MKELSIEEKAKAYDEALKYAMIYYKDGNEDMKMMMKTCFPVLVEESEDERIRKDLITYLKSISGDSLDLTLRTHDWLAWLEKQGKNNMGISEATKQELEDNLNKALEKETPESWNKFLDEQKPTDKVEPKFKVGDWVVDRNGTVQQILSYKDCIYKHTNGYSSKMFEDEWRMWNVAKDAKDGDVLVASDGSIFLFKCTINCACKHYVALTTDGVVKFNKGLKRYWETSTAVHPSTKEQRDTLIKAIADAGYTFDFENKELKKIEQKPQRIVSAEAKESMYDKPAWSEEDEKMYQDTIGAVCAADYYTIEDKKDIENWLKSLKDRYTWKPSDEQLCALEHATMYNTLNVNDAANLATLYNDLKKLKG